MTKRIRLVICRHTQTDDNAQRRYSGTNNPVLNEEGERQKQRLAEQVSRLLGITAVVSSDLWRTTEVAAHMAQRLCLVPMLFPDLREVDVGAMSGLDKQEAVALYPGEHHRTRLLTFDFTDIGGESHTQVVSRYTRALEVIVGKFGLDVAPVALPRVVLVGHGTALTRFFAQEHNLIDRLHEQGEFQEFIWPPQR